MGDAASKISTDGECRLVMVSEGVCGGRWGGVGSAVGGCGATGVYCGVVAVFGLVMVSGGGVAPCVCCSAASSLAAFFFCWKRLFRRIRSAFVSTRFSTSFLVLKSIRQGQRAIT